MSMMPNMQTNPFDIMFEMNDIEYPCGTQWDAFWFPLAMLIYKSAFPLLHMTNGWWIICRTLPKG